MNEKPKPSSRIAWEYRGTQKLVNYLMCFTTKNEETGCRLWTGAMNSSGRPCITWYRDDGTRTVAYVYRLIVEAISGPIPPGYTVHHRCANARCISPNHLERSDQRSNIGEMLARQGFLRYIDALRTVVRALAPGHPLIAARADIYDGSPARPPIKPRLHSMRWRLVKGIIGRK